MNLLQAEFEQLCMKTFEQSEASQPDIPTYFQAGSFAPSGAVPAPDTVPGGPVPVPSFENETAQVSANFCEPVPVFPNEDVFIDQ